MPDIENGLSELESRRRTRPAPQHPKRPVVVPPPPAVVSLVEAAVSEDDLAWDAPGAAAIPARPVPAKSPVPPPGARRAVASPVRATQVYLDEETMDFLRRCSAAGLMAGSRDVTNSGVIRHAVARLSAQLDPEEVADVLLDDSNTARRSPGRARR